MPSPATINVTSLAAAATIAFTRPSASRYRRPSGVGGTMPSPTSLLTTIHLRRSPDETRECRVEHTDELGGPRRQHRLRVFRFAEREHHVADPERQTIDDHHAIEPRRARKISIEIAREIQRRLERFPIPGALRAVRRDAPPHLVVETLRRRDEQHAARDSVARARSSARPLFPARTPPMRNVRSSASSRASAIRPVSTSRAANASPCAPLRVDPGG